MDRIVNGPGEARHADIAICGGKGGAALFVKGVNTGSIPEARVVEEDSNRVGASRTAERDHWLGAQATHLGESEFFAGRFLRYVCCLRKAVSSQASPEGYVLLEETQVAVLPRQDRAKARMTRHWQKRSLFRDREA